MGVEREKLEIPGFLATVSIFSGFLSMRIAAHSSPVTYAGQKSAKTPYFVEKKCLTALGEGDVFLGLRAQVMHALAKEYKTRHWRSIRSSNCCGRLFTRIGCLPSRKAILRGEGWE